MTAANGARNVRKWQPHEVHQQNVLTADQHRSGFSNLANLSKQYISKPFQFILRVPFQKSRANTASKIVSFRGSARAAESDLARAADAAQLLHAELHDAHTDLARAADAAQLHHAELQQAQIDLARAADAAQLHYAKLKQSKRDLDRAAQAAQVHHADSKREAKSSDRVLRAAAFVTVFVLWVLGYRVDVINGAAQQLTAYLSSDKASYKPSSFASDAAQNASPRTQGAQQ